MTLAASLSIEKSFPNIFEISGGIKFLNSEGIFPIPTTSTASQIDRIRDLEKLYNMKQPGEIFEFFYENPDLVEVAIEAVTVLKHVFGTDAGLTLELIRDPETDEQELFALIEVNLEPEEALKRLQEFDNAWLLDKEEMTKGLFNVDVSFA